MKKLFSLNKKKYKDYCVRVKCITLCNFLLPFVFLPAVSETSESQIGIYDFKNIAILADQGSEFSFFQSIHVRIDTIIDISISIRPNDNQIWQAGTSIGFVSNEINQAGACDVITSRSCDKLKALCLHYHSIYGHQTWQDGNLP